MSLSSPEMVAWRVSALAADAPWTPTPIQLSPAGDATAETGEAMGFSLTSQL
jgi:hypothetical protein